MRAWFFFSFFFMHNTVDTGDLSIIIVSRVLFSSKSINTASRKLCSVKLILLCQLGDLTGVFSRLLQPDW